MRWPFVIAGTTSMPVIWLVAIIGAGLAALAIGASACAPRASISS